MGLMDAIKEEPRIEIKSSDMQTLLKNVAKGELMWNGIQCEVPYQYMREMLTGQKEEAAAAVEEKGEEEDVSEQ